MYVRGQCLNLNSYKILLDGLHKRLCKGGKLKTAQQLFQHLFVNSYQLDVKTYFAMISGLCKNGLFDGVMILLLEMDKKIIIRALLERNENDKAEKLLREIISRGVMKL
ncbi:hypothetical protein Ahy_B02g060790 [Arachis hypogaea]|uniref:Pentatricopeptide repeat-containing protein n=1 Tax=Arachis hypogaea TaxID=3818 RepID=A0A445AJB8_ARAHY|nr:hypothetical protein Ahy_B02g060790 [Arachis hypogaea]